MRKKHGEGTWTYLWQAATNWIRLTITKKFTDTFLPVRFEHCASKEGRESDWHKEWTWSEDLRSWAQSRGLHSADSMFAVESVTAKEWTLLRPWMWAFPCCCQLSFSRRVAAFFGIFRPPCWHVHCPLPSNLVQVLLMGAGMHLGGVWCGFELPVDKDVSANSLKHASAKGKSLSTRKRRKAPSSCFVNRYVYGAMMWVEDVGGAGGWCTWTMQMAGGWRIQSTLILPHSTNPHPVNPNPHTSCWQKACHSMVQILDTCI